MTTIQTHDQIQIDRTVQTSRGWTRLAGFAGIAFVVLFIAMGAGIAADAPVFTDGADELRTWFGDHQGAIGLFTWLAPFVVGFLQLTFAVGLLRRLAADDTSGGILPRVAFGGIVASFAAGVVGLSLWGVMTLDPILENASDGLLLTLSALDSIVFFALMPWTSALFIIAASVLIVQSRAMPNWLAGLGILSGVVSAIGGTWLLSGDPGHAVADVAFAGELAGMLWILIASVFMLRSAAD